MNTKSITDIYYAHRSKDEKLSDTDDWQGMKKGVVDFVARCLKCQKVKVEHKHPPGFIQPFPIPKWKWEVIMMDFITKFPRTAKQQDSIIVVVDKLTKVNA